MDYSIIEPHELRKQESILLDAWRKLHILNYSNFVRDGIIDHENYLDSNLRERVVILLREAHWLEPGFDHSMINDLKRGVPNRNQWHNWQVIARWIFALTEEYDLAWPDLWHKSLYDNDFRSSQFKKVAIINSKKEGGRASLDSKGWKRLTIYCDEHPDLICQHIELCSPTVIICSGTFEILLYHLYKITNFESVKRASNGVEWSHVGSESIVAIKMPHFGARGKGYKHIAMHQKLVDAWSEIKHSAKSNLSK